MRRTLTNRETAPRNNYRSDVQVCDVAGGIYEFQTLSLSVAQYYTRYTA